MIYLNRLPPLTRPAASPARFGPPDWLPWLAVPVLLLILSAPYRAALTRPFGPALPVERARLQGLIDALHAEGAVLSMAPCHDSEVCVRVTGLFRALDASDRTGIGRGIARHFAIRPDAARPVSGVRFIDAQSGVELGRFADNRLAWTHGAGL